ncbi:MAG TPA: sigma 54-interacting transcriptional regulator [Kofleriaceae bacterium]|nr:sigma 54-interacting transcriptional regulator [Kofleriaceae bacterium]
MTESIGQTAGETLGATADAGELAKDPVAELIVALECDRPAALSVRISLEGVAVLSLGRGKRRAVERRGAEVAVTVADRWMSSQHARLRDSFGRWVLEDLDSKNGTSIGRELVQRRELADGDVIEVGRTFLVFRAAVVRAAGSPLDVDLEGDPSAQRGLRTFNAGFARELDKLARLAAADVPLLLYGESGTGKEVLARAFHEGTGRPGPLVPVNCGAIPDSLVESELFGHRKGAFSGAAADSDGLVRAADRGTLFLDEIGDLPASSQAALLRVIQERQVRPVGATAQVPIDVRVVSATHRDLGALVAAGSFREDLYARISGFRIEVPPLRQRREDLGMLIGVLLGRIAGDGEVPTLDPDAARALFSHPWPRNIRELESALAAAVVLADGAILPEHLPHELADPEAASAPAAARPLTARELEHRDELIGLLQQHGGNISAVSRACGKDRKQVHRWLERYGLAPSTFREGS